MEKNNPFLNLNHNEQDQMNIDEDDEIEKIIKAHRKIKDNQIQQDLTIEMEKSLEWLNFFFSNAEVRELYTQNDRIKNLLLIQCLFYLNVFKSLYTFRYRVGKAISGGETTDKYESSHTNQLNVANLTLPQLRNISVGSVAEINMNTNYNNYNNNLNNQNIIINSNKDGNLESSKSSKVKNVINTIPVSNNNNNYEHILSYKHKKEKSDKLQNFFKLGVIGCGSIGSHLVKHLIAIKDNNLMQFKIIVSTRRPNMVDPEILNSIDDNIEIVLDNEKVFAECSLIFLCVLPHQLDLLLKEISQGFKEQIDKLRKKKNSIYPTIISLLSAVPIERLKVLFPNKVNIQRTFLDPHLVKKLSDNNYYKNTFGKQNSKQVNTYTINKMTNLIDSKSENSIFDIDNLGSVEKSSLAIKKGGVAIDKEIVKYTEEASSHLFNQTKFEFVEYLLSSFHQAFYSVKKQEENYTSELVKSVLGENGFDLISTHFDNKKIIKELREEVNDECKYNFMKIIRSLFKNLDN